eukprot:CAMPEP_0167740094 /NCGR_PEP_ID=MMETSP0110_2-20121227/82_1 /TAXON_ID=629695 /ORGANISM="Gymnochlora sp., Strain CCMP2014" /LENGTH=285 /DNA_ID=CAMNT_0007623941 /DNA_START=96 /DNA_END=953 /DNA_ORIENTATION=+
MTEMKATVDHNKRKNGYGAVSVNVEGMNGSSLQHLPQNHPKMNGKTPGDSLDYESINPDLGDGGFRAFVLAFMDGFVTTLCFVLTVGSATESVVLFAGCVSAFAGIFSMAIGEWISMQLQNDGLELELTSMRKYQKRLPRRAAAMLQGALREKYKLSQKTLDAIVSDLKDSGDYGTNLIDFWSRVGMGIDPDELGGKPLKAVMMCALGYGVGAFVPLISWFIGAHYIGGFKGCVVLSLITTIIVGGALSRFTAYHWSYTIFRQVAVTFLAAGAVYVLSINMPQGM